MADLGDPVLAEQYRRYVSEGKQEARNGNFEESIRLFRQAFEIHPSEKLTANIKKLEEALASLALDQEEEGFVDVCQSGLMLYGEMYDKLFDHQREGVAFLYSLYRDGRKGGILADDMGLGKTIQIIAFLSGMFDAEHIRSVLLIMPTTLVSNWTKEFASWTPGLRVKVFHGTCKAERNRNLERIQRKRGVLLTTYQMLLNNWQQLSSYGGKEFVWDYVILDEAHKIKTPSAKTTKSAHAIPAKHRILLTGTPVQNNLKELWALFDFACQGSLLGTIKTFRMEYEDPITRARAKDATPGEKALGLKISENLMSIIKPYFLRRSKEELLKKVKPELTKNLPAFQSKDAAPEMPSLPRKNDFIVWVYLAPIQEEIYQKFLSLDHIKELLMTTRSPLAELNVLKKLCDHPRLLSARACSQLGLEESSYSETDSGENEANELLHRNIEHISDEILTKESGKLRFLVLLLERLQEEGHRTLVFSQSRKMLDIIERILTRRHFKLLRIDGRVTHLMEREKRIGVFQKNSNYSVFLLTTQVGGVGLTLTAATRVVIFDPSWNPATDAQAVDRAYRIGQKENVVIYRLITCGTVEEKIYRRQVFKDSLIRQSTGDKKNPYRYFSMQELRELFTLEDPRTSTTQLQLQSLHASQRKTDTQLDEHIAYLYSLEIFGISDHDLMYTHETVHEDEADDEEGQKYIEHRVQKAQELVQLESQLKDQLIGNMRSTTEGAWLREMELSTQPKKKTPKPPQNHVPPVTVEPTSDEVVDLVTDEDGNNNEENGDSDIVNVSSKMASLIITDVDDERMLRDISNMDISLSKNEECTSARLQEYRREHHQRTVSPFPRANLFSDKENCHPELKMVSHDPFTQVVNNEQILSDKSNMDISLSKNEECKSAQLQECEHNQDLKTMPSFLIASSLSNEENRRPESQTSSCDLSAAESIEHNDVQVKLLKQPSESVSVDKKQVINTELSPDVRKSYEETYEIDELDAEEPSQPQANNISKCSTVQKCEMNEMMLENESFTAPSPHQADSILVLEDSQDRLQVVSKGEMLVEEIKDEAIQLRLDSRHSSAFHPWAGENEGNGSLQMRKDIMESVFLDGSKRLSDALMENNEVSFGYKKKPIRRIVSDDEVENYDLVTDDRDNNNDDNGDGDIVSISSKIRSLVVDGVDDERMLQNISDMDISLSKNEECKSPRLQEYGREHHQSTVSPFPQANSFSDKEDCHPELKMVSHEPLAQDVNNENMLWNESNMDISLSKNEECKSAQLQECEHNQDLKAMPSFLIASSLSNEENRRPESQTSSCDLSATESIEHNDVQVKLLKQPSESVSVDKKQVINTELSPDVVRKSYEETYEIDELDAEEPSQPQANNISKCSTVQKCEMNEMMLENESFTTPSPYQADFNLVLEDSEDGVQVVSREEMSLEEIKDEGFQLRLDSHCGSVSHSWAGEKEGNGNLQTRKNIMESMLLEGSNQLSDALMDNSDVSFGYKKKPVRRIVSDDEEEQCELVTELDDSEHRIISALNNKDIICMSTPKFYGPRADLCFSPRVKVSGRRSTASRRSIANLVMDQVEDMAEVVQFESGVPSGSSFQNNLEREMSQKYSGLGSMELEEEPSGETLDSEDKSSYLHETDSLGDESSF